MTQSTREKLKELLEDKYPEICRVYSHNLGWYYSEPKELLAFIEQIDKDAEYRGVQKGNQEMKQKCLECIPPFDFVGEIYPEYEACREIHDSISKL